MIDDVLTIVDDTLANFGVTALQRLRITPAQTHEQHLLGREREVVATGRLELEARFGETVCHLGGRFVDGLVDLLEHRALGRLSDFEVLTLFGCWDRTGVLGHVFSVGDGWRPWHPRYVSQDNIGASR